MANVPVHPIISWDAGVMDELKSIVLWIQYQDDVIQDVDEMPWSPVFLLDAEKARALIVELEKQVGRLEQIDN